MTAVAVLLVGAAFAGYRLAEELRVDTGGLEVALVGTVAQLAAAGAGFLRLPGGAIAVVLALAMHVVVWVGLGLLALLFGVLPWSGGWGIPAHQLDAGLLVGLIGTTVGLTILYRRAFQSAVTLRPHRSAGNA